MRVNGSLLAKCLDKKVSMVGNVHSMHSNNTGFNITSSDNQNITVNLNKSIPGHIEGLVEVHGIAQGPATIACDYYIEIPYNLSRTYDAETDDEAVNLAFRVPNPWK